MSKFADDMKERKIFGSRIICTHEIGEYQFIETGGNGDGKSPVYIYVNGHSIGYHAYSIDMALIVAIAHKHDGRNSQAPYYFARMIGMKEE